MFKNINEFKKKEVHNKLISKSNNGYKHMVLILITMFLCFLPKQVLAEYLTPENQKQITYYNSVTGDIIEGYKELKPTEIPVFLKYQGTNTDIGNYVSIWDANGNRISNGPVRTGTVIHPGEVVRVGNLGQVDGSKLVAAFSIPLNNPKDGQLVYNGGSVTVRVNDLKTTESNFPLNLWVEDDKQNVLNNPDYVFFLNHTFLFNSNNTIFNNGIIYSYTSYFDDSYMLVANTTSSATTTIEKYMNPSGFNMWLRRQNAYRTFSYGFKQNKAPAITLDNHLPNNGLYNHEGIYMFDKSINVNMTMPYPVPHVISTKNEEQLFEADLQVNQSVYQQPKNVYRNDLSIIVDPGANTNTNKIDINKITVTSSNTGIDYTNMTNISVPTSGVNAGKIVVGVSSNLLYQLKSDEIVIKGKLPINISNPSTFNNMTQDGYLVLSDVTAKNSINNIENANDLYVKVPKPVGTAINGQKVEKGSSTENLDPKTLVKDLKTNGLPNDVINVLGFKERVDFTNAVPTTVKVLIQSQWTKLTNEIPVTVNVEEKTITADKGTITGLLGDTKSSVNLATAVKNVKINGVAASAGDYDVKFTDDNYVMPSDYIQDNATVSVTVTDKKNSSNKIVIPDVPLKIGWGNSIYYMGFNGVTQETSGAFTIHPGSAPSITATPGGPRPGNPNTQKVHSNFSNTEKYYSFSNYSMTNVAANQTFQMKDDSTPTTTMLANGGDIVKDVVKKWGTSGVQKVNYGDIVKTWALENKMYVTKDGVRPPNSDRFDTLNKTRYFEVTESGYAPLTFNILKTTSAELTANTTNQELDQSINDYIDLGGNSKLTAKFKSYPDRSKASNKAPGVITVTEKLASGKSVSYDYTVDFKVVSITADKGNITGLLGDKTSDIDLSKAVTNVKINDDVAKAGDYDIKFTDSSYVLPSDYIQDTATTSVTISDKKNPKNYAVVSNIPVKIGWGNSIYFMGFSGITQETSGAFTIHPGNTPSITATPGGPRPDDPNTQKVHGNYSDTDKLYSFSNYSMTSVAANQIFEMKDDSTPTTTMTANGGNIVQDVVKKWGSNGVQAVAYGDIVKSWTYENKMFLTKNGVRPPNSDRFDTLNKTRYFEVTESGYAPLTFNILKTTSSEIPIKTTKKELDNKINDYIDLANNSKLTAKFKTYPNTDKVSDNESGVITVTEKLASGKFVSYDYTVNFKVVSVDVNMTVKQVYDSDKSKAIYSDITKTPPVSVDSSKQKFVVTIGESIQENLTQLIKDKKFTLDYPNYTRKEKYRILSLNGEVLDTTEVPKEDFIVEYSYDGVVSIEAPDLDYGAKRVVKNLTMYTNKGTNKPVNVINTALIPNLKITIAATKPLTRESTQKELYRGGLYMKEDDGDVFITSTNTVLSQQTTEQPLQQLPTNQIYLYQRPGNMIGNYSGEVTWSIADVPVAE